jgi:hypothetical protein
MKATRSNLLFAFLMGGLIGLLIRRHRERKQAYAARQKPPLRRDHAELNARWQDKRPNSIN